MVSSYVIGKKNYKILESWIPIIPLNSKQRHDNEEISMNRNKFK